MTGSEVGGLAPQASHANQRLQGPRRLGRGLSPRANRTNKVTWRWLPPPLPCPPRGDRTCGHSPPGAPESPVATCVMGAGLETLGSGCRRWGSHRLRLIPKNSWSNSSPCWGRNPEPHTPTPSALPPSRAWLAVFSTGHRVPHPAAPVWACGHREAGAMATHQRARAVQGPGFRGLVNLFLINYFWENSNPPEAVRTEWRAHWPHPGHYRMGLLEWPSRHPGPLVASGLHSHNPGDITWPPSAPAGCVRPPKSCHHLPTARTHPHRVPGEPQGPVLSPYPLGSLPRCWPLPWTAPGSAALHWWCCRRLRHTSLGALMPGQSHRSWGT